MKHGFVKVAAAVPFVRVADCGYNVERIERMILDADSKGVEIITFPELCITGYTCSDLFLQPFLIYEARHFAHDASDFCNKGFARKDRIGTTLTRTARAIDIAT